MSVTLLFRNYIAGITCLAAFGCNEAHTEKKFEFYYYPSKNVYYDVANAMYVYSLNGGNTWDTLLKKMVSEPALLGSKQIIYSSVREPWDSNEIHRQLYGGTLISVTGADSISQHDVVTDRKIPKRSKPVVTPGITKKTEKKPGFFKRLFGKKH